MTQPTDRLRLLLLSGSLRRGSSNGTVLRRAARVADDLFAADFYDGLGDLPAFNPDLEELGEADAGFPAAARELRERVAAADALLVSTPEYAHGLPGSLKNALDWLVGSSAFPGLPLGLINVSPRSVHAPAQFLEVVRTMSALVVDGACVTVDRQLTPLGESPEDIHPGAARVLRGAMEALALATRGAARTISPRTGL